MDALSFAVRLLIAGTLIASATPKLLAPLRFRQIVMQYSLLPPGSAGPFSRALPLLEVALGTLLLTGTAVRATALMSAALFAGFAGALLMAGDNAKQGDCGCMGRVQRQHRPWLAAADIALALAASLVAYDPGLTFRLYQVAGHEVRTHVVLLGLVLLTLALSCAGGFLMRWRPQDGEVSQWRRHLQT